MKIDLDVAGLGPFLKLLWTLVKKKPTIFVLFTIVGAVAVLLALWVALLTEGPILLQAKAEEPAIFRFPVVPEFEDLPPKDPAKVQVLIQRKVVLLTHWAISDHPKEDCVEKKDTVKCDEAHILESWTAMYNPDNPGAKLVVSTDLGEFGAYTTKPRFLTHQSYEEDGPDPRMQTWTIYPDFRLPWTTDLILVERDAVGVFQPSKPMDPADALSIDICKEGEVGIALSNAVGTAEFMVTTSPDVPEIKPGSTHLFVGEPGGKPKPVDSRIVGDLRNFDPHDIDLSIGPSFLKSMAAKREDFDVWIAWEWNTQIDSGPLCGKKQM